MSGNIVKINMENEGDKSKFLLDLPKPLSIEEKKYLLFVERGDLANARRMLQVAFKSKNIDVNCVDSHGRGALTLAIDSENYEMVELLVVMGVDTKDSLLHSIDVGFVEAVELLLEHEELIYKEGQPYSWQKIDSTTASYTPDITPLILAAHRNNYEILTILLSRGATLPMPHDIKCGCVECLRENKEDSLRQALSRLNEYKALASSSLIALSSSDPILTCFQLSWELRNLAFAEPECKSEYLELRKQCQQFAVDLLQQSRSSKELAIILNHDPECPGAYEEGEHMKLTRLELAVQYKQKKFVAHPNIQQLLASIWYEGVPGFRRKTSTEKIMIIIRVALFFPFYCVFYMLFPNSKSGLLIRKPFMKFLIHASSYLFFLLVLILVSQRAEDHFIETFGTESMQESVKQKYTKQRGNSPSYLEYLVVLYVLGFIMEETQEMLRDGINYLKDLWNFIDFTRNLLYCLVFVLRTVAYIKQKEEISVDPGTAYIPREKWEPFDPQLIAEGLFAAANIFSALKLVHLFSINPHLGPLQISLGRMVIDIVKFFFIYSLVLFAFACGLNQLMWYYSNLERDKCFHLPNGEADWNSQGDACMKWRRFANVFESSQSLFWASFGMIDLGSFELEGIKTYTRFWGLLMFGSYSVINVIVLLNLLIAMMSNSYSLIEEHSDTEWKFARTKLWMSYFEERSTLPPPFNIFPTPKIIVKCLGLRKKDKMRKMSTKSLEKAEKERDYKYSSVMRALVWRYICSKHRQGEESQVTEDDVNEVKSEITSFRCELMEVLGKNGMDVADVQKKEKIILGKKMKVWERRLMKDFQVGPVNTEEEIEELVYEKPPANEDSLAKFRRIAKLAVLNSSLNKWKRVVAEACIASQIGHCNTRHSFKKQQNLQKAIEHAKKLVQLSPKKLPQKIEIEDLPDITGNTILEVLNGDLEQIAKKSPGLRRLSILANTSNKSKADIAIQIPKKLSDHFASTSTDIKQHKPTDCKNKSCLKKNEMAHENIKSVDKNNVPVVHIKEDVKISIGNEFNHLVNVNRSNDNKNRTQLTFKEDGDIGNGNNKTKQMLENTMPHSNDSKMNTVKDDCLINMAVQKIMKSKPEISENEKNNNNTSAITESNHVKPVDISKVHGKSNEINVKVDETFEMESVLAEIHNTNTANDTKQNTKNPNEHDDLKEEKQETNVIKFATNETIANTKSLDGEILQASKTECFVVDIDKEKTQQKKLECSVNTLDNLKDTKIETALINAVQNYNSNIEDNMLTKVKTNDSSINDDEKMMGINNVSDEVNTHLNVASHAINVEKSPMSSRNIQKVSPKPKRWQPKYGWL